MNSSQQQMFKKMVGEIRARQLNIGGFFCFTPEQANNVMGKLERRRKIQ